MKKPACTAPPRSAPRAAPLLILSEFLPYRLSIAAQRSSRAFADRYEQQFGLSIPEWRVMAVLGERAPRSTQEVIKATGMDRVKVSRAAIRLADKGCIDRNADPRDERAHLLVLSRHGRDLYRQIIPIALGLQAELEALLTPDEVRALDRILAKLSAAPTRAM